MRAAAGRQAKEPYPDEIKQRLALIAGHDLGANESSREAGASTIRDRLNHALGPCTPDQQHELDDERKRLCQQEQEQEQKRERDRDLGWDLQSGMPAA